MFLAKAKIISHNNSAVRISELLGNVQRHRQPVSGVNTLDGVEGGLMVDPSRG